MKVLRHIHKIQFPIQKSLAVQAPEELQQIDKNRQMSGRLKVKVRKDNGLLQILQSTDATRLSFMVNASNLLFEIKWD